MTILNAIKCILINCVFQVGIVVAQPVALLEEQAMEAIQKFDEQKGLLLYGKILNTNPNHFLAITETSLLHSSLGSLAKASKTKAYHFDQAKYFAQRAIQHYPNLDAGYVCMSIALGGKAVSEPIGNKLNLVRQIPIYAQKALSLNANNYLALHVLGRWNYEMAMVPTWQKKMVYLFMGSLPKGSFTEAKFYLQKSIALQPNFIGNHFWLANVFLALNQQKEACVKMKKASALPAISNHDLTLKTKAQLFMERQSCP